MIVKQKVFFSKNKFTIKDNGSEVVALAVVYCYSYGCQVVASC